MERTLDILEGLATRKNLLLSIMISFISVMLLGILTQSLVYDVYGPADMPDTSFGYTFTQVHNAFDTLGVEGLQVWLLVHSVDYIFPAAYGLAMAFATSMIIRSVTPSSGKLRVLVLLPILGAIADYIENILIATQALSYPNLSEAVISVASIVTIAKWLFIYAGFAVITMFLIAFIVTRLRKNSQV